MFMKKTLFLLGIILSLPFLAFCQSRQVSGTVKNNKGEALAYATVQEKGTNNFTTTNETGRFTITLRNDNATLVISSAGSIAKELKPGADNNYDVVLEETGPLSEVVVTALGITRKERSLGYSTQEVKGDKLSLTKEQNVLG